MTGFDPTLHISIRGNWNKTDIHGSVPVALTRTAELAVVTRPSRAGRYRFEPPTYIAPDGRLTAMVWCPQCGDWKHREAFYKNRARSNGLQSWCRKHDDTMLQRVQACRARQKLARVA